MSTLMKSTPKPSLHRPVERHLPGEEGTWVFILGDMGVFTVFFCAYLATRSQDPALFTASQVTLEQTYGAINTLLLLISSLCVVVGLRAVRRQASKIAQWSITGAFGCGLGFAFMKFLEYGEKIGHGLTPTTNDFFMWYYVMTGLHFFHLIVGMAVLVFVFFMARKSVLTTRQFAFVEGGACFWHMVDLLWIVIFPLLYFVK